MKICILGPVTTKDYFGGVAVFNEALTKGFENCGCEVVLCSRQKSDDILIKEMAFQRVSFLNINRIMRQEKPDAVIASLDYAVYFPLINSKIVKTYYLHGFFNIAHYGVLKAYLGWAYQKFFLRFCDRVYANSFFTQMVNQDIMGLRVDKAIPIGVSYTILDKALESPKLTTKNNRKIIYVGRLAKSKFVDNIITTVKQLNMDGYECELEILGDGPDARRLKKLSEGHNSIISTIYNKERQAELFISLCPSESYGMSFVEALLAGCKIVCPITGGQNELIEEYEDRVIKVNPMSIESIMNGVKKAFSMESSSILTNNMKSKFSYDETSSKIIEDIADYIDHKANSIS